MISASRANDFVQPCCEREGLRHRPERTAGMYQPPLRRRRYRDMRRGRNGPRALISSRVKGHLS